eukprot:1195214-Prorocentrum_minimum.AAC.3
MEAARVQIEQLALELYPTRKGPPRLAACPLVPYRPYICHRNTKCCARRPPSASHCQHPLVPYRLHVADQCKLNAVPCLPTAISVTTPGPIPPTCRRKPNSKCCARHRQSASHRQTPQTGVCHPCSVLRDANPDSRRAHTFAAAPSGLSEDHSDTTCAWHYAHPLPAVRRPRLRLSSTYMCKWRPRRLDPPPLPALASCPASKIAPLVHLCRSDGLADPASPRGGRGDRLAHELTDNDYRRPFSTPLPGCVVQHPMPHIH